MECYFDNSATTAVSKKSAAAAMSMMCDNYGNPASLHKKGDSAQAVLDESRKITADAFGVSADEMYFTAGGTESNNTVIFGAASAFKRRGNRIIISSIEHPSVLEPAKRLEANGFEVIRIGVDSNGIVDKNKLFDAVNSDTILVSIMAVNNETGSIQDLSDIKAIMKSRKAPGILHCDAVQAFGKIKLSPKKSGIDCMSISGHKIHAPKGIGALYISKNTRIDPYILGGGQEKNMRSGTSPMPGITALCAACSEIDIDKNYEKVKELNDYIKSELLKIDGVVFNSPDNALPYVMNVSFLGIPAQVMMNYLSSRNIYVSTGSACAKGHRSYVLSEMGIDTKIIDSAIRISFSKYNDMQQAEYFIKTIKEAKKDIKTV